MAWTLCTSGSATIKAGASCSSVILGDADALNQLSQQAEGMIERSTNTSWVASKAAGSLTSGSENLLEDVCSSLIAMSMANYDATGYLSREWDGVMNFNDDRVSKGLKALEKGNTLKSP